MATTQKKPATGGKAPDDGDAVTFDLDAVVAQAQAQAEATTTPRPVSFTFQGERFRLVDPPLPGSVIVAVGRMQRGDLGAFEDALIGLLSHNGGDEDEDSDPEQTGRDQFDRFMALGPSLDHMQGLIEQSVEKLSGGGDSLGNSGESTPPSTST